jgi:hypothetical protein
VFVLPEEFYWKGGKFWISYFVGTDECEINITREFDDTWSIDSCDEFANFDSAPFAFRAALEYIESEVEG